jgi:nucleoside-diphosphate-sugar epimerase
LVIRLLQEQAQVAVLTRETSRPWRIKDVIKDIELYRADIRDSIQVQNSIKNFKPNYIYHLAAYGVNSAQQNYLEAIQTNVIGTVNIVNAARISGCEKMINVGSSSEYGNKTRKIQENMSLAPVNIYGSTKASSTIIAHQMASENGFNMVTLRPFGIFGEGEEPHKLFCHIILNVLQNKDVDLTPCEQFRDYCYIENIIDGLILVAQNKRVQNEIFNIGSGEGYPLKYHVELIFKHLKTDRKPNFGALSYREDERPNPQPAISKIKSKLCWEPVISLEEGIIRTINWYRQNKEYYLS